MGMTMTQKILARAAGRDAVSEGELIICDLDLALGNDITGPPAIEQFRNMGAKKVFDSGKIALVPDHFTPNKDIASAQQAKIMRDFAREQNIEHYFEVGRMGIEHALLPEKGLCAPGEVIIGADSHTCTYGAVNAFSTGIGSTDLASGMALGTAWFKVPGAIKVLLTGEPQKWVTGKDIILHIIGEIGVDGARYMSLEFFGDGIAHLSMDSRFSICNMAIEAGAKNGIFPVDDATRAYLAPRVTRDYTEYLPDDDAEYAATVTVDLSKLALTVACPHLPENTKPAADCSAIRIDQAVIGSCTNGRMEDMRLAAEVLKGQHVHEDVRLIIFPATQEIYKQCMHEGLFDVFIDAGAAISTPTCGPCLGGHCGILAEGERCISTTNRNFVGRMGHKSSEVYLAGAPVAAASAIAGHIARPQDLED